MTASGVFQSLEDRQPAASQWKGRAGWKEAESAMENTLDLQIPQINKLFSKFQAPEESPGPVAEEVGAAQLRPGGTVRPGQLMLLC